MPNWLKITILLIGAIIIVPYSYALYTGEASGSLKGLYIGVSVLIFYIIIKSAAGNK